jgi:5-methylcytosine-specific restriction protein A
MPSQLRMCSHPGCSALVRSGKCDAHRHEDNDRYERKYQYLYDRKWQKMRAAHLAAYPWCEACLKKGLYVPATDVHHMTPHRGDRLVFMTSQLQSLCHSCHAQITRGEGG